MAAEQQLTFAAAVVDTTTSSIAHIPLRHHADAWCRHHLAPAWDGEDFSSCFRTSFLNGVIPAAFVAISLNCFLAFFLYQFINYIRPRQQKAVALSSASARRLSTSSARRRSDASGFRTRVEEAIPAQGGPKAIAQAENEVILGIVAEQSPDLLLADVLDLGVGTKKHGLRIHDSALDEEESEGVTGGLIGKALWGAKKDVFNVLAAGVLLGLVVLRLVQERKNSGSNWLIVLVAAWAWTALLTVVKLAVYFSARLHRLQHPTSIHRISPVYTLLEANVIPWFLLYTCIAFLNLRSTVLIHYQTHKFAYALRRDAATFAVASLLALVELFSPRPSRFASRSQKKPKPASGSGFVSPGLPVPPEMNASLISLATFSFIDSFMFNAASSRTPTVTMKDVPDLRPDDKTARILLAYRRDSSLLSPTRGLTFRLMWHFRGPLMMQQFWAYVKVAVVALPPMFLQAFLGHIAKKQRGEKAPMHVALLYVGAMFVFQIIGALASSQSLYIGRRICIRIRSIIIGEVYTKALRRKDMAGNSDEKNGGVNAKGEKVEQTEEEQERASSGKIVNLISVDTFRVAEIAGYLHFIWPELTLTIVITIVLLFRVLGYSALAGVATLLLVAPLQTAASRLFYVYQNKLLAAADARLELATEVISSVRMVKYFAWEAKFTERMEETRRKELKALLSRALTMVVGAILMIGTPIIVSVTTFLFHTKVLHRDLNAETAFTSLALFTILRSPLESFTDMIVNVLQSYISLKRIDDFLGEEETAKYTNVRAPSAASDPVIGFSNATFTWSDEKSAREDSSMFRVRDLNLDFPIGKFSVILGPVASGKTTLLLSLLGETNRLGGQAFLPSPVIRSAGEDPSILTDTTAYCSQSPWLMSASIKDNILFGANLNEARYSTIIDVCALEADFKQFELGDETEVGESGVVLSGGQKARISLARAMYSSAKTVLADDVLSAVDSHTAQHIYSKCLKGKIMRHRTCVLVTHAVDLCLPGAAYVVSLENGSVVSAGAPSVMPKLSGDGKRTTGSEGLTPADQHLESAFTIEAIASGVTDDVISAQEAEEKRKRQHELKLVKDETQSEGSVSIKVYLLYLKAMGGWTAGTITLAIFFAAQAMEVAMSAALRYWANSYDDIQDSFTSLVVASSYHSANRLRNLVSHSVHLALGSNSNVSALGAGNAETEYWLRMYCLIGFLSLVFYGARSSYYLYRGVVASRYLYSKLIASILGAPIRFFDTTPTGRILNRLSKDVETIDQDVASASVYLLMEIFSTVAILGTISAVLPVFLLAAVGIVAVYSVIGHVYINSSRELKRSESVTKSPIFSIFGESLRGVATIRAYGDSARFIRQIFALVDINNRPFFTLWQSNRWLSVRVEFFGAFVVLASSIFILFAKGVDAALAGFVLTFAMGFNDRMLWLVRLWSQTEINMNSVERVKEYLELEQEKSGGIVPPAVWPSRDGSIQVEGLTASYAPELPPVLKNVSFNVLPKEKIGICGRTGSGKSTLGLSFYRFIEPTSGRIVIDGIDINTLSLPDLRSRLTIVAQEAALFAGTLRFNLDPFSTYEDADIWDALHRVQMARPLNTPRESRMPSRVASLVDVAAADGGASDSATVIDSDEKLMVKSLEMPVLEGGKNFSAGQRQLLALARGILKLKESSILILDESTASLDHATDTRIQETIREEMADATILCIAHRLATVIDYDKILVLGAGEVIEFDTPWNLLQRDESAFAQLCRNSGQYDSLAKVAKAKHDALKQ